MPTLHVAGKMKPFDDADRYTADAFHVTLALRVHCTFCLATRKSIRFFSCPIGKTRPAVPGKAKQNVQLCNKQLLSRTVRRSAGLSTYSPRYGGV